MSPEAEVYYDPRRVRASCTWGFAEDVLVVDTTTGDETVYTGLTVEQARKLAGELLEAADQAEEMDRCLAADLDRCAENPPPFDPTDDLPF